MPKLYSLSQLITLMVSVIDRANIKLSPKCRQRIIVNKHSFMCNAPFHIYNVLKKCENYK